VNTFLDVLTWVSAAVGAVVIGVFLVVRRR
jgi:hypothetical protein